MKVSTRLIIGFGLMVLLLLVCNMTSLRTFHLAKNQTEDLADIQMKKYQSIVAMRGAIRDMGVAVRNSILFTDKEDINTEVKRFHDQNAVFIRSRKEMQDLMQVDSIPEGRAIIQKIEATEKPLLDALKQTVQLGMQNNNQAAITSLKDIVRPVQNKMLDALNSMTRVQMGNNRQAVDGISSAVADASKLLFIMTTLSIIVSIAGGYFITRSLMRQLGGEPEDAQKLAATIAGGNLTSGVLLRRNDTTSLLASLVIMQTQLRGLVSKIKDAAASVAMASSEIAQGNTELSSRTEQQAAALQETAASMEQLSATVKSNTASAQKTVETARETGTLARAGEADVKLMTETMKDISLSSVQVRDITSLIEGIAFQTNILALNAAVEAARAGGEGRGFAVVAGEVRTLAQRSASAAKEIKELTEKSVLLVENGVAIAGRTGQSIMKVVGMVGGLEQAMEEISLASTEQMQGISQVTIAVNEMDGVTQSNAALVEESSTASRSLSEQASSLRSMVETFAV